MKRPERDALASHKGQRSFFPYVRYATIQPPFQFWHSGPRIKLEGNWLEEAGFYSNWRIKVTVHEAKLIIEPLIKPVGVLVAPRSPHCRPQYRLALAQSKALSFG